MKEIKENGMDWYEREKTLSIYVSHGSWKKVLDRYLAEGEEEIRIKHVNPDGSYLADIPASWVRIRKPSKRNFTPEQREAAALRLASVRQIDQQIDQD